jgi:1,4-dihydroxy-2-naphthoate octaprenyltransferase
MSTIPLKTWFMAFRPKTLSAGFAPVIIATAMAFGDGLVHWPSAFICLLTAVSIQIGTNIANDYFDFKKGADTEERIGPTRVTQAGLIKPETVRTAFIVAFAISALCCILLVMRAGWPLAIIGIISIISGILYTGGPKPLGYIGLGDVFVLIFFGPVAVGGTYYVQTFELNTAVILAGFGPGLISCAILAINNMRDIDSDSKTGKNTLAVRFGRGFARYEYLTTILVASLLPILIFLLIDDHRPIIFSAVTLFIALPIIKTVFTKVDGPSLNSALAQTGKLLVIYSMIFSIGWLL